MNQQFAEAIEAEWATRGLATFKQFLRDDLARRGAAAVATAANVRAQRTPPTNTPARMQ